MDALIERGVRYFIIFSISREREKRRGGGGVTTKKNTTIRKEE